MQQNLISTVIPQTVVDEATQHLQQIAILLKPYLENLVPTKRNEMAKMGDKSLPFVNKALAYADNEPMIVPNYISLPDGHRDANVANQLDSLLQLGFPLMQSIEDTFMMAGSDAYVAGLAITVAHKEQPKTTYPVHRPLLPT